MQSAKLTHYRNPNGYNGLTIGQVIKLDKKESRRRTIQALILTLLIVLLPILLIMYWFSSFLPSKKEISILISNSPKQTNQIEIRVQGENFYFANAPIRIYYGPKRHLDRFQEKHIKNDGKNLSAENFKIQWLSESRVLIVLSGEEQPDEIVEFDVVKGLVAEAKQQ